MSRKSGQSSSSSQSGQVATRPTRGDLQTQIYDPDFLGIDDTLFHDFFDASRGVNRLLGRLRSDLTPGVITTTTQLPSLAAEVIDHDKSIDILLDVPGFPKDNIKVNLEDNVLTIQGVREKENVQDESKFTVSERSYGKFERRIRLPKDVDENSLNAKLSDGVLKIIVKKTDRPRGRNVAIE